MAYLYSGPLPAVVVLVDSVGIPGGRARRGEHLHAGQVIRGNQRTPLGQGTVGQREHRPPCRTGRCHPRRKGVAAVAVAVAAVAVAVAVGQRRRHARGVHQRLPVS